MDEGGLMSNYNTGFTFADGGVRNASTGIQGKVAGPMGQFAGVKRALGSPAGRMGTQALMGMLNGQNPGQAALGAGLDYGKSELMKYGTKQLLGGALGGQAAGFLGGPYGMLAMAALPYLGKGISSLGKSLGIGKRSGPSAQELAMGEAKGNLMGMRGSYGTDMGTGQAMLDKYNPMLESQIGRMQELADRGLSTEYNTRQMAGAAANTESARRAAEARMKATGGMLGGGQALAGYGGINQAAVGGMAQGAYNAAQTNMNSQPGYINQLSGMIGGQINRGQNMFNMGRQGMMGLDQNLYNLNAQEKARADAISQANRTREAQMISGVANLAGTAAGMEQSRKQNRDYMNMLYGNDGSTRSADSTGTSDFQYNNGFVSPTGQTMDSQGNPVQRINNQGMPINEWGEVDVEAWARSQGANLGDNSMPNTYGNVPLDGIGYGNTSPVTRPQGIGWGFNPRDDYQWEGSRSVTPMGEYMGGTHNNGQYDPDQAAYVQSMIQSIFGGR
jgi:hypothetical protein